MSRVRRSSCATSSRVHGSGGDRGPRAARRRASASLPGELVAVMGPSGSGKSTLLNLAGGLDAPTSGDGARRGHRPRGLIARELAALRRRSVGYVFQDFNLIPALTAAENVALPRELDGVRARAAPQARRSTALEEVGLDDVADRFPDELSGGQRQRVAIARALVGAAPARARRRADRRARQPDRRDGSCGCCARAATRGAVRRARHARGAARRLGRPRRVPARRRDGRRHRRARRRPRRCSKAARERLAPRAADRPPHVMRNLGRSLLIAVLVAVPVAGATIVDVLARTLSAASARRSAPGRGRRAARR